MANYDSLVRFSEVQRRAGYSRAWIYRFTGQGRFPKQVKIGSRAIVFVKSEIDERIEKCILESRDEVV